MWRSGDKNNEAKKTGKKRKRKDTDLSLLSVWYIVHNGMVMVGGRYCTIKYILLSTIGGR